MEHLLCSKHMLDGLGKGDAEKNAKNVFQGVNNLVEGKNYIYIYIYLWLSSTYLSSIYLSIYLSSIYLDTLISLSFKWL